MYEAIFVSDAHLGSSKNGKFFLEFLEDIKCKKLFLIGDLIDVVCDNPEPILDDFFKIIKNKECEVYYFLGNHEKENPNIKKLLNHYYKDKKLYDSHIYNGIKYKIFIEHGDSFHNKDIFNRTLKYSLYTLKKFLFKNKDKKAKLASKKGIYYKIKPFIRDILYNSFTKYMINQAKKNNCNAIICGHLHHPQIQQSNPIYVNCGDWLKYNSFIVEDTKGNLELKIFK
jgi:UDP-2,3-diacylglucosamine pyrophosphatase LpxH